jgi:hypothetical protein
VARTTRRTRPTANCPIRSTPEQHAGLLQKFGIDPQELTAKLGGGAIGDRLGL